MKTLTVHVTRYENGQKTEEAVEIPLTPEMEELQRQSAAFWKRHEEKSNGCAHEHVDYFPDAAHPECQKHCYACIKCGAIVQIG
jgi:hypothetical protein